MQLQGQFVEKQVHLKAGKIVYWQGGLASSTPPILFLHGWGISAEPYREVLNLMAQKHSVIAPDLPGFAQSREFGLIESYGQYAELLIEVITALKLEKVHLVGHSLGGGIALTIASLTPQKVQSLVLVDSTGVPIGSVPEVLMRRAVEMPLQISLPKLYLQLIDIPKVFLPNLIFNPQNVIQALLLSLEKDLRPLFSQIQCECLLLWSKKDLTTPLNVAEEFHQRIKRSQLVAVDEGYHEWALLYPEKFAALISNFVSRTITEKPKAIMR